MIKKMQHVVPVLTSQMFFVTFVVNTPLNRIGNQLMMSLKMLK